MEMNSIFYRILSQKLFEDVRKELPIMDNKMPLISYTLAVMSGICFVGGLVVLSSEGGSRSVPTRGAYINDGPSFRH